MSCCRKENTCSIIGNIFCNIIKFFLFLLGISCVLEVFIQVVIFCKLIFHKNYEFELSKAETALNNPFYETLNYNTKTQLATYFLFFQDFAYCQIEKVEKGECEKEYLVNNKGSLIYRPIDNSSALTWKLIAYGTDENRPNPEGVPNRYFIYINDKMKKIVITYPGTEAGFLKAL